MLRPQQFSRTAKSEARRSTSLRGAMTRTTPGCPKTWFRKRCARLHLRKMVLHVLHTQREACAETATQKPCTHCRRWCTPPRHDALRQSACRYLSQVPQQQACVAWLQVAQDYNAGLEYATAVKLVGARKAGDAKEYMVEWSDGGEATWESEDNITRSLVTAFERSQKEGEAAPAAEKQLQSAAA